jgi:hypothetical protein
MNDFVGYLQARIAETKRDLQEATEQLQRLSQTRQMFTNELQGYEQVLSAEIRRQDAGLQAITGGQGQLPLTGSAEKPPVNKAEFARQYICDHAAVGVTPNDLFDGFVVAQVPIKKPYIYSLVLRLVEQKAIMKRRGKYYPLMETGGESGSQTEG